MTLTLDITKMQSGTYEARLSHGGQEVTGTTLHESIAAALRTVAQDINEDFAHFVEARYGGVSSGTIGINRLAAEADVVADHLVAMVAALHRSEEELAHRRAKL